MWVCNIYGLWGKQHATEMWYSTSLTGYRPTQLPRTRTEGIRRDCNVFHLLLSRLLATEGDGMRISDY